MGASVDESCIIRLYNKGTEKMLVKIKCMVMVFLEEYAEDHQAITTENARAKLWMEREM